MCIFTILLTSLIIFVMISASISDIRSGIISNKILLTSFVTGNIINMLYFIFVTSDSVADYLLNLLITSIVSILFYSLHIWTAGDSKLIIVLISLIPSSLYSVAYNITLIVFVYIFSFGFIYLITESVILFIRDNERVLFAKLKISVPHFIKRYLTVAAIITIISQAIGFLFPAFYNDNHILLSFGYIFVILFLQNKRWINKMIITVPAIAVMCVLIVFSNQKFTINWIHYIILACTILLKSFAEKYNYQTIPAENVKKGMILSLTTIMLFQNSKIKGLPEYTTEDLRSRITAEEAASIQRWTNSKHGRNDITIVRKMPFAVIISTGILLYMITEAIILW